jgi:group I intron endonuclease
MPTKPIPAPSRRQPINPGDLRESNVTSRIGTATGCVYLAENTVNGKKYIGKTNRTLSSRKKEHQKHARYGSRSYFHKAIRLYGFESFIWTVLFKSYNAAALCESEQNFIKQLNTKVPRGYNLTDGGEGRFGLGLSEETKEKLRQANLGKKHSSETKIKMSEARKGKPKSDKHLSIMRSQEYKSKISRANKGRKHTAETKAMLSRLGTGRKQSRETRDKIGEAHKGKKHTAETKALLREKMVGNQRALKNVVKPDDEFGRLTVISLVEVKENGIRLWLCSCKCGGTATVMQDNLRSGNTSSCGCLRLERLRAAIALRSANRGTSARRPS